MQVILKKFTYKKMEYEKDFCIREVAVLFPNAKITDMRDKIILDDIEELDIYKLDKLTYIDSYSIGATTNYTLQSKLERSSLCNSDVLKRQSTRYSVNGLHEYKGKFNPQIVNGIKNILDIPDTASILEPFCGSGTTLIEMAHRNIHCTGIDINPMAVFITNTKIDSLSVNIDRLKIVIKDITKRVKKNNLIELPVNGESTRMDYLKKWIPEYELQVLETVLSTIVVENTSIQNIIKITFSDLIREYSLQEPSDMRIRKRISPFPEENIIDVWLRNIEKYVEQIQNARGVLGTVITNNCALNGDIKYHSLNDRMFDAAITSPPYATALPYIDTQRISLVWAGLCEPESIIPLESTLIGSREILSKEKGSWNDRKSSNSDKLPQEIYSLINEIENSLSVEDGFRKRAMPVLLYRYFTEMKQMFINVHKHVIANGKFALVVGHNKTTAGGHEYQINTPNLLAVLATHCGWNLIELIPLQTYKRYGINSKNAINQETLIVLANSELI